MEPSEPTPEGKESIWRPGERSTFGYVVIAPLMLIVISITLLWVGVLFDVVPRVLAVVSTTFLAGVAVVSLAMLWSIVRRISRERTVGRGHQ